MTAPRVLGLDLSLTATGVCLPDGTTHTIKTRDKDGDRRLLHIGHAIANALAPGADLAVIEGPGRFLGNTGHLIGMVHGVARVALIEAGVPYAIIAPSSLKLFATGKSGADKTAMAIAALKRAGREFADDKGGNECDAWWLRAAGLDHHGHPEFPLPAAQREALAKAAWPQAGTQVAA